MKQSRAIVHLHALRATLQKIRGAEMDRDDFDADEAALIFPWMFGKKCPLSVLSKVLDKANDTGELTTNNYCNFAYMFARFMPAVYVGAAVHSIVRGGGDFPKIDELADVRQGWESES